jgi:hypothetical protein
MPRRQASILASSSSSITMDVTLLASDLMDDSRLVAPQGFWDIENTEDIRIILRPYPYLYPATI